MSLPLPLSISTHTHTGACHPSDRSPVDSVGPGRILWTQFIRFRANIVHPLNSLLPPTRRLCHPHALCLPTSRRKMPVVQLLSLHSRLSPSRITGSSSGMPEHVSLMSERQTHFMCSLPLLPPALSVYTFLHSSQSYQRRVVWNGAVSLGMAPCPPIRPRPPCSLVRACVQSLPASDQ